MNRIWRVVRKILLFCVVSVLLFPSTGFAVADGGIFVQHQDYFYVEEDSQFGVIDYHDGIQSLLISVSFAWRESSNAAWIFPIPSDPAQVEVGIGDGHVSFAGTDIVERARDDVTETAREFTLGYSLSFVLPWFLPMMTSSSSVGLGTLGPRDRTNFGLETGVSVYSHVEMEGLVVEVISATEGEGIYQYLTRGGLYISEGAVPELDEYVQDEFAFVVTWIEETGTTLRNPGVIVRFPTDGVYYPLKLTSVYGDHTVPMEVIVVGHVTPGVYWNILPHTEVSYYEGSVSGGASLGEGDSPAGHEMERFVDDIREIWDRRFTVIEISAPSSAFTEDLWITLGAPPKVPYAITIGALLGSLEVLTFFLVFLVLSPLVGIMVGALVLGQKREHVHLSAVMGLSNLAGILGLLVFALSYRLDNQLSTRQAISFVILFSIVFYTVVMMFLGMAFIPLL